MDVFDLVAKLSLDDSEAEKGLSGFADKAGSLLGGAAKAAAGAMAAATTAVVGFTGAAVKVGSSFDSSMSQVAATMGTTVDQIGELRDFAQEMGAKTSFSASQAADALNYMALAGYDAEKSMAMLPNVLNLAAAGGMELAEASDMVTDASSALGLTTEETTALVDKMAAASSKSNTSVAQLGAAMLAVGGTAKSMAGGTTEISTALGILADNGTKGAEGGTALRNVLLGIQGDKFEKTFGALGVSAYDADGNLRPLKDTLADMNDAMAGMTEQEKTDIISKTFNKADLKNVNALLSTTTERWDELSGAIDGSAGAAQKMADTQLDNLEGDITKLGSAWEGLQIKISDKVTPSLREFVQFGTAGISRITDAIESGGISGAFEELGNILSEGLGKITEAVPDVIDIAGKLLEALAQGFSDNIEVIITAAGDIALQLLRGLVDATNGEGSGTIGKIISALSAFFEEHGEEMLGLGKQLLLNIFNGITSNIKSAVGGLVNLISGIAGWLSEEGNLSDLVGAAVSIVTTLATAISDNATELGASAADLVVALAEAIIEHAPDLIPAAIELVVALADGVYGARDKLGEKGPDLITALAKGIKSALQKIYNLGPETINKFIDGIQTFLPNLIPAGGNFIINLVQGISQHWGEIKTAATQTVNYFGEQIKATISQAKTWGADMINNFVAGIKEKWDALKGAVGNVAQGIKNKLGHSHPVEGPLADDYKWMPDMMDLFIEGIENNKNRLFRTVENVFDFGEMITPPSESIFSGSYRTTQGSVPEKEVTVILQLDKTQLGKTVFKLNNEESRRIGVNLVNA